MAQPQNPPAQPARNNRTQNSWALPIGIILGAWSGAFAYAAWRQHIQLNDLRNAPIPKTADELKHLIETTQAKRVFIRCHGNLKAQQPIIVKSDSGQTIEASIKRDTVFQKVASSVVGTAMQQFSVDEQYGEASLAGHSDVAIQVPKNAPFEFETVAQRTDNIGSPLLSALLSMVQISYPYQHVYKTGVVRNNQRLLFVGDVAMEDGQVIMAKPNASWLKPRPYFLTRSTELELVDKFQARERLWTYISGGSGVAALACFAHYFSNKK